MKKNLIYFISAFMLILAAGCSQEEDVAPMATQGIDDATSISQDAKSKSQGLQNIKVTGVLEDGSTFAGEVDIYSFRYDEQLGLLASGEIKGTSKTARGKKTDIRQTFTDATANLTSDGGTASSGISAAAECQILFLDLGPIFLDVLGLQVDLSEIVLDVTAVSGAGNLLGNLLCAVAGLLDGTGFLSDLLGGLTEINTLLAQINAILSDIVGGLG